MSREVPEPWAQAMRDKGIGDPRNGAPSYGALGKASGVAVETVRRLVLAMGSASPETVQAVAEALGKDVRVISKWVGQARKVRSPYIAPPQADLLDDDERKAITQMIRLLAKSKVSRRSNVSEIRRAGPDLSSAAASKTKKPPNDRSVSSS